MEGDLVLWDGPLGKTVGSTHPDLFEVVDLALQSETPFARSMRTSSRVYKEVLVNNINLGANPTKVEEVTISSSTTAINIWYLSGLSGIVSEQCVTQNVEAASAASVPQEAR